MSRYKKFFELLGISENSSLEEIKQAYKKFILKNHPDKNKNADEELVKFVNEVYEEIISSKSGSKSKTNKVHEILEKIYSFIGKIGIVSDEKTLKATYETIISAQPILNKYVPFNFGQLKFYDFYDFEEIGSIKEPIVVCIINNLENLEKVYKLRPFLIFTRNKKVYNSLKNDFIVIKL